MNMHMDSVLRTVVESMLPRFSDHNLGLWISLDLHYSDHGYDKDGNTRIRKAMDVRMYPNLLFMRPSNYTKVFFWMCDKDAVGLDICPKYQEHVWDLKCDHDSCWSSFEYLQRLDSDACSKLRDRAKDKFCYISEFHSFSIFNDPCYVELTKNERVHPHADRFTDEGRLHKIAFREIHFSKLRRFEALDPQQQCESGILIEGSEDCNRYIQYRERVKENLYLKNRHERIARGELVAK